ncbi:MAG: hypothetical protein HY952_11330 [Elusimicrobia bacterium]|nr:hypothetical protein [Elusimicrobiota bacterium]
MNLRKELVLLAGGLVRRDFSRIAGSFGAGERGALATLNERLARARELLPAYDAACAKALKGARRLSSMEEFRLLPAMSRADLAGYSGHGALASLHSGGTGSFGRVETRLDLPAVAARYAALLSVLETTGWRMGDKTAALHPVEYSFFDTLGERLAERRYGGVVFEFFQQYLLYRLVHNRKNVYYGGNVFSDPAAARSAAEAAAAEKPKLLIARPDVLMAVLKTLRKSAGPEFKGLRAVLTVGTALGETVRAEAQERLGAAVFDMYASTELGYVALSGACGRLHADEAGHLLESSGDGGLLCTDLDNALTPVLRYDTGDLGELSASACSCGRRGPALKFRGRRGKFAETASGRLYETEVIDRVFQSGLPFFQLDAATSSLLLPAGCGEREAAAVREALGLRAGEYGASRPGSLKISSSGKFCYLP